MNTGWISLHRKLLDWEWYRDLNTKSLFIHLLLKANHQANKWQGMTIKRGQLVTSLDHLAKETALSVQQIRTSLLKLKSTHEITSKSTSRNTVITIIKYDEYQSEQQANQQTNNKQITTNNNDNNENNYKYIYNKGFEKLNEKTEITDDDVILTEKDYQKIQARLTTLMKPPEFLIKVMDNYSANTIGQERNSAQHCQKICTFIQNEHNGTFERKVSLVNENKAKKSKKTIKEYGNYTGKYAGLNKRFAND